MVGNLTHVQPNPTIPKDRQPPGAMVVAGSGSSQHQLPAPLSLAQPTMMSSSSSAGSSAGGGSAGSTTSPPSSTARCQHVSPGVQELVQSISDNGCGHSSCLGVERPWTSVTSDPLQEGPAGSDGGAAAAAAAASSRHRPSPSSRVPPLPVTLTGSCSKEALDALANSTAITNAVRLLPLGYRPGVTGSRVGLLEWLRTRDMYKYDEVRGVGGWWRNDKGDVSK
jgi:hypothetical protein